MAVEAGMVVAGTVAGTVVGMVAGVGAATLGGGLLGHTTGATPITAMDILIITGILTPPTITEGIDLCCLPFLCW